MMAYWDKSLYGRMESTLTLHTRMVKKTSKWKLKIEPQPDNSAEISIVGKISLGFESHGLHNTAQSHWPR